MSVTYVFFHVAFQAFSQRSAYCGVDLRFGSVVVDAFAVAARNNGG
jgi:hypothetical protein